MTNEQIEKLTESKPRHDCELWVEEFFGLTPLIDEHDKVDADYGQLVNLCSMVKDKLKQNESGYIKHLEARIKASENMCRILIRVNPMVKNLKLVKEAAEELSKYQNLNDRLKIWDDHE